jgi:hypothetical protein
MKLTKLTIATIASAAMIFGGAAPAMAYPVGTDTQLVLSQTSAIRAGKVIKVKAKNVDRDCEVTFEVLDSKGDPRGNENEDYDIASAFSGANYSTAYTGIAVPETAGEYKLRAYFESTCKAAVGPDAKTNLSTVFQVGKVTRLSGLTLDSSRATLARPSLIFKGKLEERATMSGGYKALAAGQSVVVTPRKGGVAQKAITVKTAADGSFAATAALTKTTVKGDWSFSVTYTTKSVATQSSASATLETNVNITAVIAKALAAKAAKLQAAKRIANINKLTR